MNKSLFNIFLSVCFAFTINLTAQETHQPGETESNVPELSVFHEVMYPIWHTAYPDKDYAALRSYVDEVNALAEDIYSAELPGILRDKKQKWDEGIEAFKKSVIDYNEKAAGEDDAALLKAAEELHTKYEMLVRIIRPVLIEVDEFHKILYVIYHYYLPEDDFDSIRSVKDDMLQTAEAVTKAALPKRLEAKTEKYNEAANELFEAVKELAKLLDGNDNSQIPDAVEDMHTKYQTLEEIF